MGLTAAIRSCAASTSSTAAWPRSSNIAGARIDGPLWSAHVLEDEPEKLVAVHRAYIEAGAQCIATCSYQVSRMGYAEAGLPAAAR